MNIFTELIKENYINTAVGFKIYTTPCRVCGSVRNHVSVFLAQYAACHRHIECPDNTNKIARGILYPTMQFTHLPFPVP